MRTKWCKDLCNYLLNGGKVATSEYTGSIKMADGTVFDKESAYMKKTDSQFLNSRKSNPKKFAIIDSYSDLRDSFAILIFYLNPLARSISSNNGAYDSSNFVASYSYMINSDASSYASGTWHFGSGTTEPTENDYCLESPLEKVFIKNVSIVDSENLVTLVISNASDKDVTITEFGVFITPFTCYYAKQSPRSGGFSATNFMMLERRVLEAPITIEAGGTGYLYIKA